MKDSSIEWIGTIPNHWKIGKVKNWYKMNTGFTPDTQKSYYYDDESGYDWVTISDMTKKLKFISDTKSKISKDYLIEKNPTISKKGSLLYSFKLSVGKVAFAGKDIYTNEAIASFLPISNINLTFLFYSSSLIYGNANTNIYGAKILNSELILNAPIIYPPLPEQQAIANYLDDKCVEIDNLSSAITEQIEILKQYIKSVITEVVTKGLNPNAPLKDSGVEWIGMIPENWEVKPFEYILKERSLKNNPIISSERLALSIDKGITLYSEKTTNLDRFKDDVSLYKVVYPGDFVMNSMNMIVGAVGITPYLGCVSPAYYVFYDNDKKHITARFCDYIFHSKTIRKYLFSIGKGIMAIERGDDRINTCRLKVSRYDLNKLKLPLPSINEQSKIVNYLDNKCAQIDSVIKDKETQLETLAAYQKSLIYEYVTGKKEVPQLKEV